jgi:predicted  nucleic acid-binding Zn-ribbon protein
MERDKKIPERNTMALGTRGRTPDMDNLENRIGQIERSLARVPDLQKELADKKAKLEALLKNAPEILDAQETALLAKLEAIRARKANLK